LRGRFSAGMTLIMAAVFLVIAIFSVQGMEVFNTGRSSARPEEIKSAILDACVECYALEGSYPPNLEFLRDHYGIILDEERFYYYYEVLASNLLPDVEVYERK
jgi:hypothetical protein